MEQKVANVTNHEPTHSRPLAMEANAGLQAPGGSTSGTQGAGHGAHSQHFAPFRESGAQLQAWNSRGASIAATDKESSSSSSPRHIFVTRDDVHVPLVDDSSVGEFPQGRAVPFQFHLQCEGSYGEHPVDEQPGRTFYVVDNRLAQDLAVEQGTGGSAGTLLIHHGTPVYWDTIESLSERITERTGVVSLHELRKEVEKDMQSRRAGEQWMSAFLNAGPDLVEFQAFKDDFRLRKVEYLTSSSTVTTAWLCEDHCNEALEQGTVKRIF